MIVSWNQLCDYVPLGGESRFTPAEIGRRLMMSGCNLESVTPLPEVAGDTALDLEITSNRPDCLGHLGIAREISVLTGLPLRIPAAAVPAGVQRDPVSVTIDAEDLCPRYIARVIRGVKIQPSPRWLQDRLRATMWKRDRAGQLQPYQPVNNVVDITNFVLFECGQPLHAFDLDRLQGGIVVRRGRTGESIEAINHERYTVTPEMCVIADSQRPLAVAGVMGGAESEVHERTVNLLIEAAEFAPSTVRRTARMLKLHSPSSYRFERGIDRHQLDWASRRCCELILQTGGGTLETAVIAGTMPPHQPAPVGLRFGRVSRVLGIEIPREECLRILTALGMTLAETPGLEQAAFYPPSWRRDLTREIDFIEEIARIHGYDQIPEDRPIAVVAGKRSVTEQVQERVRRVLTAAGYDETLTFTFVNERVQALVQPPLVIGETTVTGPLSVHPAAGELGRQLRQSVIPSLLIARRDNEKQGTFDTRLFEISRVFLAADADQPAAQPLRIGLATHQSLSDLKGVIETLVSRIAGNAELLVRPLTHPAFVPGRAAELLLRSGESTEPRMLGWIGEVNPSAPALKELKLREAGTAAEIDLQTLLSHAVLIPRQQPLPLYPAAVRDLNFVIDRGTTWADLTTVVRAAAGPQLATVRFVDHYEGKQIPAGKKSYVVSLSYRSDDRSLSGEEVDAAQLAVITACQEKLGATQR